jgi:hypothetical protein
MHEPLFVLTAIMCLDKPTRLKKQTELLLRLLLWTPTG